HALQVADTRSGGPRHERRDRHHAVAGRDPQLVELAEIAFRRREAHADVDLVVRVVRTVVADLDAVRDELDRVADRRDVRDEARRLVAIDAQAPFDTRNRAAIRDVDQPADLFETLPYASDRFRQQLRLPRRQLDLNRLAGRQAGLLLLGLDHEPGEIGRTAPHVLEDHGGRPALAPVDIAELDTSDQVLLVFAAEADARSRI